MKSTDPTIVARATTYSGNVVRMVHVFSDAALAVYAEHCQSIQQMSTTNMLHIELYIMKDELIPRIQ